MASKVVCPCGERISTGSFPNEGVNAVISERAYDEVVEPVDREKVAVLFLRGRELVECSRCGRVLISERNGSKSTWYTPEGER